MSFWWAFLVIGIISDQYTVFVATFWHLLGNKEKWFTTCSPPLSLIGMTHLHGSIVQLLLGNLFYPFFLEIMLTRDVAALCVLLSVFLALSQCSVIHQRWFLFLKKHELTTINNSYTAFPQLRCIGKCVWKSCFLLIINLKGHISFDNGNWWWWWWTYGDSYFSGGLFLLFSHSPLITLALAFYLGWSWLQVHLCKFL